MGFACVELVVGERVGREVVAEWELDAIWMGWRWEVEVERRFSRADWFWW